MPAQKRSRTTSPKASRIQAPGYGFPTSTRGLLPWTWAEQRLTRSHNYWITTVRQDDAGKPAPHTMVVWGLWRDGRFVFSTGSTSRKARNLEQNPNCIVCTELAQEAIIMEGVAEIADVATRKKMIPTYERKYKFDMSTMKDDILSMKEPVYAVRPRVVFAMWEKHFQEKSTRWKFE
jgi:general stress protein 26